MSNNLYFIPIIARTVQDDEPARAVRTALDEIVRLGREAEYARGYANFEQFMGVAAQHWLANATAAVEAECMSELVAELGTDTFEGSDIEARAALEMIRSFPLCREHLEELRTLLNRLVEGERQPRLRVIREDEIVSEIGLAHVGKRQFVLGILPGQYSVVLDTGRVIWEGRLTDGDLLWAVAFPGEPLELAADTGKRAAKATREERLLDGEVLFRVIPGLERGHIELELRSAGGS